MFMKKTIIAILSLFCANIAQAIEYSNSDGLNFYAPDYPGALTVATSSNCSYLPMVCKSVGNETLNCSFNTSSAYICSNSIYGKVTFWSLDKSKYCEYDIDSSRRVNGSYTIGVDGFQEKGMACDQYPQNIGYRINY